MPGSELYARTASIRVVSLSLGDTESTRMDDILHIWLSFARTQEMVGSIVEARRTYRFVENQKLLCRRAALYLQLAEFEKRQKDPTNGEDFKNVLRRGIQVKAEPIQDLEKELKRYEMTRPSTTDGSTTTLPSSDGRFRRSRVALA